MKVLNNTNLVKRWMLVLSALVFMVGCTAMHHTGQEMTSSNVNKELKSITYTWKKGAFAGGQYRVTNHADYLQWIGLAGSEKGKSVTEKTAGKLVYLGDNRYLFTWLEGIGYTVTMVFNTKTKQVNGVASNEKEHYVLSGSLDEVVFN